MENNNFRTLVENPVVGATLARQAVKKVATNTAKTVAVNKTKSIIKGNFTSDKKTTPTTDTNDPASSSNPESDRTSSQPEQGSQSPTTTQNDSKTKGTGIDTSKAKSAAKGLVGTLVQTAYNNLA